MAGAGRAVSPRAAAAPPSSGRPRATGVPAVQTRSRFRGNATRRRRARCRARTLQRRAVGLVGEAELLVAVGGVERDEEAVVGEALAPRARPGRASPFRNTPIERLRAGLPVVVAHRHALGGEPADVVDVLAHDGLALEEAAAAEHRVGAAQRDELAGEVEQVVRRRPPSRTRRSRCPGSRRCCCRAGCGRSRRRRGASARPARAAASRGSCAAGARRRALTAGSSVGPSAPQFHERLSSVPSRLSSPLASLCLSL